MNNREWRVRTKETSCQVRVQLSEKSSNFCRRYLKVFTRLLIIYIVSFHRSNDGDYINANRIGEKLYEEGEGGCFSLISAGPTFTAYTV